VVAVIRRTFPVVCLLDGAVRVAIENWQDDPAIWLHTDGARVRLSPGDAHVAAVMLQAAVAEVLGEVPVVQSDDEVVAQRVAARLAADEKARCKGKDAYDPRPEQFITWARDMVAMVREASAG
jgi:hypothetical protein